jgi:hypothetical protein
MDEILWGGPIAASENGIVYAVWSHERVRATISSMPDRGCWFGVQRAFIEKLNPAHGRELRLRKTMLISGEGSIRRILIGHLREVFVVTEVRPPRFSDDTVVLVRCRCLGAAGA